MTALGGEDAFGNSQGQPLPEVSCDHPCPLAGIAHKATFDEDRRVACGFTNHMEVGGLHTAIGHARLLNEKCLNVGGQTGPRWMMVITLHSMPRASTVVVVVDADKNGVAVAVSHGRPPSKRDENIGTPGHDHFQALAFEKGFHPPRRVERQMLFVNVTDARSAIMSSMPGVQNDRIKRLKLTDSQKQDGRQR